MSLQLAVFPFDRICQILGGVISSNLELFQTKHNKVPMKVLKYFPYIDFTVPLINTCRVILITRFLVLRDITLQRKIALYAVE
jgi:hypothetical protein